MNNPPNQSCSNCRYWLALEGEDIRGVCRSHPPILSLENESRFPMSKASQWCGEWKGTPEDLMANARAARGKAKEVEVGQ